MHCKTSWRVINVAWLSRCFWRVPCNFFGISSLSVGICKRWQDAAPLVFMKSEWWNLALQTAKQISIPPFHISYGQVAFHQLNRRYNSLKEENDCPQSVVWGTVASEIFLCSDRELLYATWLTAAIATSWCFLRNCVCVLYCVPCVKITNDIIHSQNFCLFNLPAFVYLRNLFEIIF